MPSSPNPPPPAPTCSTPPPEHWMQQIWRHQRLRRDCLTTVEGTPVRILHPGFWNREAGPDFRQAVLQFGAETPVCGDVEVDREVTGWKGHHHASNPAYARVVLHVVWEASSGEGRPPTLAMHPFLDAPLTELLPWLENEAASLLSPGMLGRCCAPLRKTSEETVQNLLTQAALQRLQRKATDFLLRARHTGWDQALWEGLFTGLGYKHNGWPLRRLAELVKTETDQDADVWEARLLGVSGLLPSRPPALPEGALRVRQLWDHWWREQERWSDHILPAAVWRLSGIRPANHPQRRLALAARWRASGILPGQITQWMRESPETGTALVQSLWRILEPPMPQGEFWSTHWTLRSSRTNRPLPWLGKARTTDLAVNTILPWLLARAQAGSGSDWENPIRKRYLAWPAGQDNALLRHARVRLFGSSPLPRPGRAVLQQGLLQIIHHFCASAGPLCSDCQFPRLVDEAQFQNLRACTETGRGPVSVQAPREN